LRSWDEWAKAADEGRSQSPFAMTLGIIAIGLGSQQQAEIEAFVHSGLGYAPRVDVPTSEAEVSASRATEVLRQLLGAGWTPPHRPAGGGLILRPGESLLATSPHDRWVYTGQPVAYRSGGFFAFGSPLLVAATMIGSAAINSARKSAAEKQAAVQWRLAGTGKMMLTTDRLLLHEATLAPIELSSLLGAHLEEQLIHLVLGDGTPIALRLPHAAERHYAVLQHLSAKRLPAQTQADPLEALTTAPATSAPVLLSPDGRHWWDGKDWHDLLDVLPPGAVRSPDGGQWHDGQAWQPMPNPSNR
jgi:hypothetical protein